MKYILFALWLICSVILACSIIGLLLFVPKDNWENVTATPSTWCTIGLTLLNKI